MRKRLAAMVMAAVLAGSSMMGCAGNLPPQRQWNRKKLHLQRRGRTDPWKRIPVLRVM